MPNGNPSSRHARDLHKPAAERPQLAVSGGHALTRAPTGLFLEAGAAYPLCEGDGVAAGELVFAQLAPPSAGVPFSPP
jgi:hypothetical protein